ncbi:Mediator of RNA polymerase II transcription subunit 12-like protein [Halotydeus destructor]|nr:Mediator of RNA polymerase II transcription subunit 12-like protein [Halotydeus destructor]
MAAKVAPWLYEKRSVKRPKLGAPDVYPQDPKQKEDELTAINVKQGFQGVVSIQDEYGSARNSNINSSKFGTFFSALLAKKQEINTYPDTGRRKQQLNVKDNTWLVTPRVKVQVDAWFKDLATGTKTLSQLARKVPLFNKKEEVLIQLYDTQVPMLKAAWFIKMTAAYTMAMSEAGNKSKKRQVSDPSSEWTVALCKYMRELYHKLGEHYHAPNTCGTPGASNSSTESAFKQWTYSTQLTRYMFEENLLEKHEVLSWLLDLFEKVKSPDDAVLRLLIQLLVQYSEDFTDYELLSRRLAYHSAKRINQLVSDYTSNQSPSQVTPESGNAPSEHNPVYQSFGELLKCSHHRNVLLSLSSLIQIITLKCPTALVWHCIGDGKGSPQVNGSPLDHLPCPASSLPIPRKPGNNDLRRKIKASENEIKLRSKAVEAKWTNQQWRQNASGTVTSKLLSILDSLDKHAFDRWDEKNSIDGLYSKLFQQISVAPANDKEVQGVLTEDETVVKLLCEWAVTTKRSGEYRALVVAKLLERRQSEILPDKVVEMADDSDSANPAKSVSTTIAANYVFQNMLMTFLDHQAPVLDEKHPTPDNRVSFSNLVMLFGEFIRCDVFSHDTYMCTLISRGIFSSPPMASTQISETKGPSVDNSLSELIPSMQSAPSSSSQFGSNVDSNMSHSQSSLPMFDPVPGHHRNDQQLSWDMGPKPAADMDDAGLDADLDKLLQNIKQGQQNAMNDQSDILLSEPNAEKDDHDNASEDKKLCLRHILYSTHFPITLDETNSHDCNQRHVLLYGVGKARKEAEHAVKKVSKDIMKLFGKKSSMDISEGGKVKKPATKDGFNFETALSRFQALSYFDQNAITTSCAAACVEMLNSVANGTANYLPLIESIAFLFDLMEMALNVHGLIDFVVHMLKELVDVELNLVQKCPSLAGSYYTSIGLYIVGVLYRYQACLLVSHEETVVIFEGLFKLVKHVGNPNDCLSAERCILAYLYDLYSSSHPLRQKYQQVFEPYANKIKHVIFSQQQPAVVNLLCNTTCMAEYIANPKLKVEAVHLKQLNENPTFRFSFICNAVQAVSVSKELNHVNELSILCAELSSKCSSLGAEWVGVLKALCLSANRTCGYLDVLNQVKIGDLSIHDNLAIFTSVLIARRCFSLQDFVIHCALPSLLGPAGNDYEAEPGARLACHLLLCLFRTSEPPLSSSTVSVTPATTLYSLSSPGPNNLTQANMRSSYVIKHPCDRFLLAAAHSCLRVEPVIAVLKAVIVLGEACKGKTDSKVKSEVSVSDLLDPIDDDFNDFGLPLFPGGKRSDSFENANLGEFAKHALRLICSQDWVHEKCLQNAEVLCKNDLLLDAMLTLKQAQQLLRMICYPKTVISLSDCDMDQKQYISRIFQSLDEWSIRVSWLQLKLLHSQSMSLSGELGNWLDNVAKATIEFFQNSCSESGKAAPLNPNTKTGNKNNPKTAVQPCNDSSDKKESRVWLIAPLISKLPNSVQGKILRAAAHVLETGNWMCPTPPSSFPSKNKGGSFQQQQKINSQNSTSALLSYPPFLSLVLMCLHGQDEQRESLLKSLYSQLHQAVDDRPADSVKTKLGMAKGLQLRLSLVGGMFDIICKSMTTLGEWCILLLQLICNGVVEPQLDYELFTTVLDMLSVLIHSTNTNDASESRDDSRKHYFNLLKKLKKEMPTDRVTSGINFVKQLVPLSKQLIDVITCEPMGSLIDTKGNKIAGFDSIDKKQGLQVAEKQRVSPWDILEGHKNPAPLSWSWFGAVRYERKPTRPEENFHAMTWHTHSMRKPTSYYIEPPPLPPEDVEPETPTPAPVPEIPKPQVQVMPPMVPVSMQQNMTPQGMPPHSMSQPNMGHHGMPQPGMQQQGMSQQMMPQQVMSHSGMPQQGMHQQGMHQQGMMHQGMAQNVMAQGGMQPGMGQSIIGQPGLMQQGMMPMQDHEIKREVNTPSDIASPRGSVKQTKPKQQRRKRGPNAKTPVPPNVPPSGQQTPPVMAPGYTPNYGSQPGQITPVQQGPGWFNQQQGPGPQPGQHAGPQQFYAGQQQPPQQMTNDPRFAGQRPPGKQALTSMLRARSQPQSAVGNQFMGQNPNMPGGPAMANQGPHAGNTNYQPRQLMQQRPSRPSSGPQMVMQGNPGQMGYPMQGNPQNAPQQIQAGGNHHMGQPANQQNYAPGTNMAYGNQMQMQQNQMPEQGINQGMQGMNQGYQGPQGAMMNPGMRGQMPPQQQQHMHQPQYLQRPQYSNMGGGGPSPNVTMGQVGPQAGYGQQQPMGHQGGGPPGQHMRQQPMQGQPMQNQPMLHRQLSGGNPQQHNPYNQGHF